MHGFPALPKVPSYLHSLPLLPRVAVSGPRGFCGDLTPLIPPLPPPPPSSHLHPQSLSLHPIHVHWVKGPTAVHVLLGWGRVGGGTLETRNQPSRGSAIFSNHSQGRGRPLRAKLNLFTGLNVEPLGLPGYRSVGRDNGMVFGMRVSWGSWRPPRPASPPRP